jgi:carboxyl-terminal processing protease
LARAGALALLAALAACATPATLPADPTGRLFASGLDDITDLYLEPVSAHALVLAGDARLHQLDDKLSVIETAGPSDSSVLALEYGGRQVATYSEPADGDPYQWGEATGRLIAAARQASPILGAMTPERVETAVFDGMTSTLDRFSRYSPPALARDRRAVRDGFGGIGVTLEPVEGGIRITEVAPKGPAEAAGVRPDDTVVAIDGVATAGRSEDDVIDLLRGPLSSPVTLKVVRPGVQRALAFSMQRALIVEPTVTASRDGKIAIVHVASFVRETTQRIVTDLLAVQQRAGGRLSGIVLDLRGDPGGLLDQAVDLGDLFIADGAIVATAGRHPASRQYFAATGHTIASGIPIVVLINGGSASAAEIVAAALQDHGRAIVVGTSSYGKGTVQTVMRLPNDGELTLTWARTVTPEGYFLEDGGVVPTVCTSGLGTGPGALAAALKEAASAPKRRARAALDEAEWRALRRACPPGQGGGDIDTELAERLIGNPALYDAVLHSIDPAPTITATTPILTGDTRSLSSPTPDP